MIAAEARLEPAAPVARAQAPLDARVQRVPVEVGDSVVVGQVLVELDPARGALLLREERALTDALGARIAALQDQRPALEQVVAALADGSDVRLSQARADLRAAQAAATCHAQDAEAAKALSETGSVADAEVWDCVSRASQASAEASAARNAVSASDVDARTALGQARGAGPPSMPASPS